MRCGHVLLADLHHEHAVVALRRHPRVRKAEDLAEAVTGQVALAPATLSARRGGLLERTHDMLAPFVRICQWETDLWQFPNTYCSLGENGLHKKLPRLTIKLKWYYIAAPYSVGYNFPQLQGAGAFASVLTVFHSWMSAHLIAGNAALFASCVCTSDAESGQLNRLVTQAAKYMACDHNSHQINAVKCSFRSCLVEDGLCGAGMRQGAPISVPHLTVPAAQGLNGAAEHDDLARGIALGGRAIKAAGGRPALLDVVQAQIQADGLGQQGQQRPLLQLVVQDGCVACSPAMIGTTQFRVHVWIPAHIVDSCCFLPWIASLYCGKVCVYGRAHVYSA